MIYVSVKGTEKWGERERGRRMWREDCVGFAQNIGAKPFVNNVLIENSCKKINSTV